MTTAIMETSEGSITIELDKEKAPVSVENFVNYAKKGFYEGTIFHRVINGFVIQGGGFDEKMNEKKTEKPIANEANNGLSNLTGTIAMARTSDPNSATSQFYINLNDNIPLDKGKASPDGYAVFGKVTEGMDVVKKIGSTKTGQAKMAMGFPVGDVPVKPITIKKVTIK